MGPVDLCMRTFALIAVQSLKLHVLEGHSYVVVVEKNPAVRVGEFQFWDLSPTHQTMFTACRIHVWFPKQTS